MVPCYAGSAGGPCSRPSVCRPPVLLGATAGRRGGSCSDAARCLVSLCFPSNQLVSVCSLSKWVRNADRKLLACTSAIPPEVREDHTTFSTLGSSIHKPQSQASEAIDAPINPAPDSAVIMSAHGAAATDDTSAVVDDVRKRK
eukprot:scaffold14552_cov27-Tisochrysis_lutea.AAC.2